MDCFVANAPRNDEAFHRGRRTQFYYAFTGRLAWLACGTPRLPVTRSATKYVHNALYCGRKSHWVEDAQYGHDFFSLASRCKRRLCGACVALGKSRRVVTQAKEEIMRKSLAALGFTLSAGLYSWSTAPAFAADFYILNVTDENNVLLLDPTTIVSAQAGHKVFHFAEIGEFDLWIDNNVEVDCAGQRSRKLVCRQSSGRRQHHTRSFVTWTLE
jgi:hypothetical protein